MALTKSSSASLPPLRPHGKLPQFSEFAALSRQDAAVSKAIVPALEEVRLPRASRSPSTPPAALDKGVGAWPEAPCDLRVYGKTAVLGGSFDPPHWGTAWCVRRLLAAGARDVWLMPVAQHAEKKNQSPFSVRMLMAFALMDHLCDEGGVPPERLVVTNVESFVASGGQTLEVLRAMRRLYAPRNFVLAVGADVGQSMVQWPKHYELMREFSPVVLERPGGYQGAQLLASDEPAIEISSTQIRNASMAGNSIHALLPKNVLALVQEHGLYKKRQNVTFTWRVGFAVLVGTLFVSAMVARCLYFREGGFNR